MATLATVLAADPTFGTDPGLGIPGWFVAVFVLIFLLGVASAVWRVVVARQNARDAGLDEGRAGAMALLDDGGVNATYLAAALRRPQGTPAEPPADSRPVAERLRRLEELRDQGLITAQEHDDQRRVILGSL